jgi:sugar phosphate isomerase/epimerase
MPTTSPPVVGAALPIGLLPQLSDWLLAAQRDIEIQDCINPEVLDSDWQPLVHEARAALDGYTGRLGIHAPFDGLTLTSRDQRVQALVRDRLAQALEFAAALGATHMVTHSPFLFFGKPFAVHLPAAARATQIDQAHAVLDELLPTAHQIGCTIMIETILDSHPDPLRDLVQSFQSPHVRLSLDTGHAFLTHQRGGPTPDQWVREAGALLGHVHLQDNDGNSDRHWIPGRGSINWGALFDALAELDHQPRLLLELRDYTAAPAVVAWFASQGWAR